MDRVDAVLHHLHVEAVLAHDGVDRLRLVPVDLVPPAPVLRDGIHALEQLADVDGLLQRLADAAGLEPEPRLLHDL